MKKRAVKKSLRWYTHQEVFGRVSKRKEFKRAYREETLRLKLAVRIKTLRNKRELTQKMLAQKVGMPQSVIARIESGERGITVDTLGRVAHAVGKEIQLV